MIQIFIDENVDAVQVASAISTVTGYKLFAGEAIPDNAVQGPNYIILDEIAYLTNPFGTDQRDILTRRKSNGLRFNDIGVIPYTLVSGHQSAGDELSLVEAEELFQRIITEAIQSRASDVHIKPQNPEGVVLFRIDGRLIRTAHRIPLRGKYENLVNKILILCGHHGGVYHTPVGGRIPYTHSGRKFPIRVEMNPLTVGEDILPRLVLRIPSQSTAIFQLQTLGLSAAHRQTIEDISRMPDGLVLVTGPTGSGKTTTLYAALNHIADQMPYKSIATLEDPVELEVPRFNQIQIDEDQGLTFATGIRSLLRSDPDVMLVGEIRDTDTGVHALRAAITGHLVLSTLHTKDTVRSIGRLVDLGLSPKIVADALLAILAQRMVRCVCRHCAKMTPFKLTNSPYLSVDEVISVIDPDDEIAIPSESGCAHCRNTGFVGRHSINEIMMVDEAISSMISEQSPARMLREYLRSIGHTSMWHDGLRLIRGGVTSFKEVEVVLGPLLAHN
jgi:type IV pilus assembly protein PilB